MIKASGKSSVVLVIVISVLILVGVFVLVRAPERHVEVSSLVKSGRANRDYQNNLATLRLKGRVKSIQCEHYVLSGSVDELVDSARVRDFEFDEQGNVTREAVTLYDNGYTVDYTYDGVGNYNRVDVYKHGALLGKSLFVFDGQGRVVEVKRDRLGGYATWKSTYEDVANGYVERVMYKVSSSSVGLGYNKVMDTVKRELRTEELSVEGKKRVTTVRYNKRGRAVERVMYDDVDKPVSRYTAAYDSKDRLVREDYTADVITEHYYVYDDQDNVLEYTRVVGGAMDRKSYRAVYTYDKSNNWIHRDLLRIDGSLKESVDRVITYY